jgi:hypothetical protein
MVIPIHANSSAIPNFVLHLVAESRGMTKRKSTPAPLWLDATERMRTRHQELGLKQVNTFTSKRYAVKPTGHFTPR